MSDIEKLSSRIAHRAWGGFGRIDPLPEIHTSSEAGALNFTLVGCFSKTRQEDELRDSVGMIHGSAFGDASSVLYRLHESSPLEKLRSDAEAILSLDGSFAFISSSNQGMIVGRDSIGGKPLYLGIRGQVRAISSEMKPLHILGLEVKRFPPGKILLLSTRGDLIELAARYWPVPENTTFTDHDGSQLLRLLESSVKRRIANRERIAISFSGGVDSSLLALIAKKYTSVVGITVGSENSMDQLEAKKYADLVGIDLVEVRPTFEDVRRMLGVVRNLAEVSSVMDLSIALAFYLSAKAARDAGCDKMFVGQLADELFGGYARYIRAYCNGNEDVERMMNNDVLSAAEKNIERDEKSSSPFVDLEIPYSSLDLVNYALRCPLESKFNCSRGIGKAILRKAAMTAGMPEQIALKPKKAIQYSSGLNKLVSRLSP